MKKISKNVILGLVICSFMMFTGCGSGNSSSYDNDTYEDSNGYSGGYKNRKSNSNDEYVNPELYNKVYNDVLGDGESNSSNRSSSGGCSVCGGDGRLDEDCSVCDGTGKVRRKAYSAPNYSGTGSKTTYLEVTCDLCEGTEKEKCEACNGTGKAN